MAIDINTVIPDFSISIIDPNTGRIDPIWYQFLLKIFDRTEVLKNAVTDVTGILPIASTGGTTPAISILPVTIETPGAMLALDKIKLDSVTAGAAVATVTGTAPIVSSGGNNPTISITAASGAADGAMVAADKTKLDSITAGAAVATVTGTAPIISSGGTVPNISITPATTIAAGSLSATDKVKLDGIGAGATVTGVSGTAPIISSGGAAPAISIVPATASVPGSMSAADKAKLDSIPGLITNFLVWQSVAQTVTTNAQTKLTFTTKSFDDNTEYSTTTSQFTCTVAGTYAFTAGVSGTQATANRRQLSIYVNSAKQHTISDGVSTGDVSMSGISGPVKLSVGDTVQVYYFSNLAETTAATQTTTYFGGWRIK